MRFTRLMAVPVVLLSVLFVWAQAPRDVKVAPRVDATSLPIDRGAAALHQLLKKLDTRASLIMIVAHPDDEDGGMLAYETRGQGARATLLQLNRGEGGQNVMSDDYWDRLGEVRTQELLQADRYYGTQQYWTHVVDFGFAKTKEEALQKWGYNTVLADVVRVVRMTRPLVITSSFIGGPTDGHGHHQVAGMMAQEVFKAAGDPNMFPDQIKEGLRPWKPLKVYGRVPSYAVSPKGLYDYATGHYVPVRFYDYVAERWINGKLPINVEIPEGNYDPVLGMTYVQVAREGLGFQKSQNGGVGFVPPSAMESPYHRFGSAISTSDHENSYFDGIDTSLMGIADLAKGGDAGFLKSGLGQVTGLVEQAIAKFNPMRPAEIAPLLAQGLKATRNLIDAVDKSSLSDQSKYDVNFELKVKETQFNDALADALGVHLLASIAPETERQGRFMGFSMGPAPSFDVAIPGQQFWVKVSVTDESTDPVKVTSLQLKPSGKQDWSITPLGDKPADLMNNKPASQKFKVVVPENAGYTRPYFTRKNTEQSVYTIHVPADLNLPTSPYPLSGWATLEYNGVPFTLAEVIQAVNHEVGPGIVLNPMLVGPAISVSIDPHAGIVPLDGQNFTVTTTIHNNVKGEAKGTIKLGLPQGWTSSPSQTDFDLAKDGQEQHVSFDVTPHGLQEKAYDVTAIASYNGQQYTEGYQMTGYPGLRNYPYYRPAVYQTTGVNVKVAKDLNVGYVEGTGDDVPGSLKDLGINVHFLTSQDLASGDLSKYDVILLGIRAYAARADLITYNSRLLDYVKNGGVVIVQYNTGQYDHDFGPYPYTLGNAEKVINEDSAVQILAPSNPALSWPNKITPADFKDWVEERGHGFMTTWDPHYQALLEMHDPDQDPQKGGLLYARYGKGVYVYTALALYRQLPEGVPGAYRITANLLSLAHNPDLNSNSGQ